MELLFLVVPFPVSSPGRGRVLLIIKLSARLYWITPVAHLSVVNDGKLRQTQTDITTIMLNPMCFKWIIIFILYWLDLFWFSSPIKETPIFDRITKSAEIKLKSAIYIFYRFVGQNYCWEIMLPIIQLDKMFKHSRLGLQTPF